MVAIKLLLMFDDITTDRVLKEVCALASLRHPNLILFMGFCLQPRPAIICEFMQRGSLFKVGVCCLLSACGYALGSNGYNCSPAALQFSIQG